MLASFPGRLFFFILRVCVQYNRAPMKTSLMADGTLSSIYLSIYLSIYNTWKKKSGKKCERPGNA